MKLASLLALAVLTVASSALAAPSNECVWTDDHTVQGETLVCEAGTWVPELVCGQVVAHCMNVGDDSNDTTRFDIFEVQADGSVRVWY